MCARSYGLADPVFGVLMYFCICRLWWVRCGSCWFISRSVAGCGGWRVGWLVGSVLVQLALRFAGRYGLGSVV